jgi:hypothetical protein
LAFYSGFRNQNKKSIKFFLEPYKMSVEDRQLYEEMRQLSDFASYPIPESWFKDFNIPRNPVSTVEEFLKSGYTERIAFQPKNLPPLIINEPQQNGKLVVVPDIEVPEVLTITRPFDSTENFPTVLPFLTEERAFLAESLRCTQDQEHLEQQNPLPIETSPHDLSLQEQSAS